MEDRAYKKITIITPTFNQGKFIEKSINSVIAQNYPNLEYIIIDGGSTDETVSIIKKYEEHITYWISEKDNGQSAAINKGLKKATGDIINWLNSDDFLDDNALFTINECFSDPNFNVVAGYSTYIDEKGVIIDHMKFRTYINKSNILSTLTNTSLNQPSTFFKKEVFDRITPLTEKYHYNMDLLLWLKYLCLYGSGNIQLIDDNLSVISYHKDAKTVKDFHKTFPEKESIYLSLFTAFNDTSSDINFDIRSIPKDRRTLFKLKQYYYRYRLFKRNISDERMSFSLKNLINYVYYAIRSCF